MTAAFVEAAEHLVVFQTEYLNADDESLESAHEQVAEDNADPVGVAALRACKLQDYFHDRRMADSKCADTDKRDCI